MRSTYRNVYPDSDFFPEAFQPQTQPVLDLKSLKVYQIHGEAMIKLADLQALGTPITGIEGEASKLPKAA